MENVWLGRDSQLAARTLELLNWDFNNPRNQTVKFQMLNVDTNNKVFIQYFHVMGRPTKFRTARGKYDELMNLKKKGYQELLLWINDLCK